MKVKVTLEGQRIKGSKTELVQAINSTFMHGFQNNLAQGSPLRVKVPSETFVNVRLLTPSRNPPPPPRKNPDLDSLTIIQLWYYSHIHLPPLPQRPHPQFFFRFRFSSKKNHLPARPFNPSPLPPSKTKKKKKKKKKIQILCQFVQKKKNHLPTPPAPLAAPPPPQFFSSDLDSLSICKKNYLDFFLVSLTLSCRKTKENGGLDKLFLDNHSS